MKLGIIGTGNMGSAILKGYLKAKPEAADDVIILAKNREKLSALAAETGTVMADSVESLVFESDVILFAVKPYQFDEVLPLAQKGWSPEKLAVSVAAGITLQRLQEGLSGVGNTGMLTEVADVKAVRAMPNTPAMVGEGMTAVCRNAAVTEDDMRFVMELFGGIGKAEEITEQLMDSVIGVSGSSPAYVYLFIEALADGAVAEGMPRSQAYTFAAQAVLGSAKMVLETGLHPGQLKDQVCSPGGTTIEAVTVLEDMGLRSAVTSAVRAAAQKSRDMSK
ncbi:MAG: pyrroline-5-carboxylate reductase [Clostridiales bacterium]|nr:pyrroline-5-carboxylate reductase [Clostridiales bacterium]